MKVLLSIKPEFVEAIFNGKKHFEYRKSIFKKDVKTVVIYATKPLGKIVGEFDIDNIISDHPDNIWKMTKMFSGIDENFFSKYFQDRDIGYAIKIKHLRQYTEPICPYSLFKDFKAPQSYKYLYD